MNYQHESLASGRWRNLSLIEQLANIGSEVERALNWRAKGNLNYSQRALERALELISLTIEDPRHRRRLKEITRLREAILDISWEKTFISRARSSGGDISMRLDMRPGQE